MGQMLDEIPGFLIEWMQKQHMFWVASAPLSPDGHVNISPKGITGTFHIVNSRKVWYEDLSGSGAETIAHIRENGRITVLFHAFEGPARIVRLYGKGTSYELGTPEYEALLPAGVRQPGSRSVIVVDVYKVGTTCGYAVPYYTFVRHRTQLLDWAEKKEVSDRISNPAPKGMRSWWISENTHSLDGLPALTVVTKSTGSIPPSKGVPPKPENTLTATKAPQGQKTFQLMNGGTDPYLIIVAFLLGVLVTSLSSHVGLIFGTHQSFMRVGT